MAAVAWFAVALLLMLVGLVGAVLPLVPGLPLVLAGVYLYALTTGLGAGIGLGHLVVFTLIGGATIILSSLANLLGVRAAGVLGRACSAPWSACWSDFSSAAQSG